MRKPHYLASLTTLACVLVGTCLPVYAQDEALDLESAPVEKIEKPANTKLFFEAAIGNASQRYQPGSVDTQRASLDWVYSGRVSPSLRAVLSNRTDIINPAMHGSDSTVNSLREAYISWQPDGGDTVVDLGRINLRNGPSYGYNPTDFFRDGSLRLVTSADPFALRQNRLGSVMLRAQRLWNGGSVSAALSPKLADAPSNDGWNADLGSTNNRDRALLTLGTQFSQTLNTQVMLYQESGLNPTVGFNMTALLSDAAVAHMEWTYGNEPDLLNRTLSRTNTTSNQSRFAGGLTYTTLGKTSITAEYQYNGFALDAAGWSALGPAPTQRLAYLQQSLRLQELAPRQAYLIYVSQKGLGLKDLDLTAYLRVNGQDDSKLAWLELRHHWPSFDMTFQLQHNIGNSNTEFGVLPESRNMQILGTYYF